MFLGSIRDDDENLVLKGIRRAPGFFLSFFLSVFSFFLFNSISVREQFENTKIEFGRSYKGDENRVLGWEMFFEFDLIIQRFSSGR